MPRFSEEIEFNISVDEFLTHCSSKEIKELIQSLKDDNHLNEYGNNNMSIMEEKHNDYCNHLKNSYSQISQEDYIIIENLSKKYGGY